MSKKGKKKTTFSKVLSTILGALIILACVYFRVGEVENLLPELSSLFGTDFTVESTAKPTTVPVVSDFEDTSKENAGKTANDNYTDDSLEVYFFDVGQADAILLLTGGKAMLVDTGNRGDADVKDKLLEGNINLTHELKRLGVERINVGVITHDHEDHGGAAYKLYQAIEVDDIYTAAYDPTNEKGYYTSFWEVVEEKDVHIISPTTLNEAEIKAKIDEYNAEIEKQLVEIAASGEKVSAEELPEKIVYNAKDYIRLGDTIEFGEALVTMVAPSSAEYSDTNDYSIVLMVEFEGVKLLLTGDAGKESEEEILTFATENDFDLNVDILKVGHHGSRTASTEAFIEAVDPEYAIVMVEEGNSYGLPDEDVYERLQKQGATIYSTMEKGDIKLTINDGSYEFDFSYEHEEKSEE